MVLIPGVCVLFCSSEGSYQELFVCVGGCCVELHPGADGAPDHRHRHILGLRRYDEVTASSPISAVLRIRIRFISASRILIRVPNNYPKSCKIHKKNQRKSQEYYIFKKKNLTHLNNKIISSKTNIFF